MLHYNLNSIPEWVKNYAYVGNTAIVDTGYWLYLPNGNLDFRRFKEPLKIAIVKRYMCVDGHIAEVVFENGVNALVGQANFKPKEEVE